MAQDFWRPVCPFLRTINSISKGAGRCAMNDDTGREYVLAMARELYGRAVYTHKTHEKERQIWSHKAGRMYWVNLGLVSATTIFAVISVALQPPWVLILTALFASATTAFVVWQSSFDPVGKENRHRT